MRSINSSNHHDHSIERLSKAHTAKHTGVLRPCGNRAMIFPSTGYDKSLRSCDMAVAKPAKTTRAWTFIHGHRRSEQRQTRPGNTAVCTNKLKVHRPRTLLMMSLHVTPSQPLPSSRPAYVAASYTDISERLTRFEQQCFQCFDHSDAILHQICQHFHISSPPHLANHLVMKIVPNSITVIKSSKAHYYSGTRNSTGKGSPRLPCPARP
ncbi:hypothetical protein GOBAR_AA28684 [Gossypium barbadense]|uniref:Uncharacterized protein n=1 Tax=Gossypium barbadense TaxID=3634 RepID=A0A2P5WLN7_GOSBA|nr:hypothetical protein GOBAR_AA28684 [Gossypium barbadense]